MSVGVKNAQMGLTVEKRLMVGLGQVFDQVVPLERFKVTSPVREAVALVSALDFQRVNFFTVRLFLGR